MNMLKIFNPEQASKLSIVTDPFKSDKIVAISLDYSKSLFEKCWEWRGTIKFKNGNTEGSQKFKVADSSAYNSFEKITQQMQTFINSL